MKMLIGERETEARGGEKLSVYSPSSMQVLDTVPAASREDVDEAITCAQKGFGQWSATPLAKRIDIMRRFQKRLMEEQKSISELESAEQGKTLEQSETEVRNAAKITGQYCDIVRNLGGETFPSGNWDNFVGDLTFTVREPLGVVACILPYNFPVDLFAMKVVPALLMGNAAIVKPSSETPLCDIRLTQLMRECGVPANAIQIITGSGAKIGNWLTGDDRLSAVSMTGSTEVGAQIAKNSAEYLHPVMLELGGNDALIILEDADLEWAVEQTVFGRMLNSGQVCSASKRFLIQNSIREAFTERLAAAVGQLRYGDPFDRSVDLGPLVSVKAAEEVEKQIYRTMKQGAKLLCGGKRENAYIQPTILTEVTPEMDIAGDMEVFGPVWPVIGFDTVEQAILIANHTKYGLSSGVIGADLQKLFQVARGMEAGACIIGGTGNYRTFDQPFGGYKMSGLGREGGKHTLEEMSQLKTIVLRRTFQ